MAGAISLSTETVKPMSVLHTRSPGLDVLVTGTASDAHTWNLIFLQLYCEERGCRVVNLGPCVPDDLLIATCRRAAPDLVVVSSVNGHGYADGLRAVGALRGQPGLTGVPAVIGGKLGTDGALPADQVDHLLAAGYAEVFDRGDLAGFDALLADLADSQRIAS
jgi:methylaspartate mutase sigma subunit